MASDQHCLASVEKGSPNHDGVMVGRTDTANSDGRGWGCARACMHACVRDVFAIYDNDILPMLIMIIINIIILYFIQIRHTDVYRSSMNKRCFDKKKTNCIFTMDQCKFICKLPTVSVS